MKIDNNDTESGSKYVVKHKETWIVFDSEKDYFRYCNSGKYKLDNLSVIKYLYSDNLCNRFIFTGFFVDSIRIPSGLSVEINNNKDMRVHNIFYEKSYNSEHSSDTFVKLLKDRSDEFDGAALLFSGGLDSAVIKSLNVNRYSFHLNYHGDYSRTKILISKFRKLWSNISIIDNSESIDTNILRSYFSNGVGIFASFSQIKYQVALANRLNRENINQILTGQNADTLLCVDHHLPATQVTGFRRRSAIRNSRSKRERILDFGRVPSAEIFLERFRDLPGLFGFGEHLGKRTQVNEVILRSIHEREKQEYDKIAKFLLKVDRDISFVQMLKVLRWFRTCANAVDNYKNAANANGIKRRLFYVSSILVLRLINTPKSEIPVDRPKFLLEDAFKKITGRNFRILIETWMLSSLMRLCLNKIQYVFSKRGSDNNSNIIVSDLLSIDKFRAFYLQRLERNFIFPEIKIVLDSVTGEADIADLSPPQLRLIIIYMTCQDSYEEI